MPADPVRSFSADPLDVISDNEHDNDTAPAPATNSAPSKPSATSAKKPSAKKASTSSTSVPGAVAGAKRQRGISNLPTARVQRIIKIDRDVDICSREASFLIAMATDFFVKKLTDEAYTNARLDKRKVVQYKDLSKAVQQNEYLEFLKEAIPTPLTLSNALSERQAKMTQLAEMEAAILAGTLQEDDSDGAEAGDGGEDATSDVEETRANGLGQQDDLQTNNGEQTAPKQRPAKKVKSKSRSSTAAAAATAAAQSGDVAMDGESGTAAVPTAADETVAVPARKSKMPTKRTARQSAAAVEDATAEGTGRAHDAEMADADVHTPE